MPPGWRYNPPATMPASAAARCDRRRVSGHGGQHEEDDGSPCVPWAPPPWEAGSARPIVVQGRNG
eukprot:scaffold117130_cov57-Phaeocystis_antarctica.AAC.1